MEFVRTHNFMHNLSPSINLRENRSEEMWGIAVLVCQRLALASLLCAASDTNFNIFSCYAYNVLQFTFPSRILNTLLLLQIPAMQGEAYPKLLRNSDDN